MVNFYGNKTAVAEFVSALLQHSNIDWPSITITKQVKSGEYSVHIAIDTSSDDTVKTLGAIYLRML